MPPSPSSDQEDSNKADCDVTFPHTSDDQLVDTVTRGHVLTGMVYFQDIDTLGTILSHKASLDILVNKA